MEGTIEYLADESKGFGFIKSEDYEKNLFFHAKDLIKVSFSELARGAVVSIEEVEETPKGLAAKGIRLI